METQTETQNRKFTQSDKHPMKTIIMFVIAFSFLFSCASQEKPLPPVQPSGELVQLKECLQSVESRLGILERRPDHQQEIGAISSQFQEEMQVIDSLRKRLDDLEGQVRRNVPGTQLEELERRVQVLQQRPDPSPQTNQLREEIATLKKEVASLRDLFTQIKVALEKRLKDL